MSEEERVIWEAELARIDAELAEVEKALGFHSGPYVTGQSKDFMKGSLELRLATSREQRSNARHKLGLEPDDVV